MQCLLIFHIRGSHDPRSRPMAFKKEGAPRSLPRFPPWPNRTLKASHNASDHSDDIAPLVPPYPKCGPGGGRIHLYPLHPQPPREESVPLRELPQVLQRYPAAKARYTLATPIPKVLAIASRVIPEAASSLI